METKFRHRPTTIEYKNRDWLRGKYSGEKLSAVQISRICGVDDGIIYYWLRKFHIPIRSYGKSSHLTFVNHCTLSLGAIEWINGELLGDGCLYSKSPYSAYFGYASKYFEYIEYVSDILNSFGIRQSGKTYKRHHTDRNMDCYSYNYHSRGYEELSPLRIKWYPKGRKIIPRDIILTPLTLRQFYIGDGSLVHREGKRPYIELCTCGFIVPNVEFLIKKLVDLGFKAARQLSRNTIRISAYSTRDFLDYIGECPAECYKYKWDYFNKNRRI